jgi:hypothetical protein
MVVAKVPDDGVPLLLGDLLKRIPHSVIVQA